MPLDVRSNNQPGNVMTRGMFKRLRRMAPVAALLLAPFLTPAEASPALLIDAANGRVLYEEQASDPWYPASVTKLMTTYIVLKEIRSGRLSLDTPLRVSANAAKTQPSKMGFKPGTIVTIDNALKMMLVKSANDIAVVLAEGVGGSVEGFTAVMNAEARRLGMNDSYFVNPHGLMDPRQRTTARDMGILAHALLTDFPRFQSYFGIGGVQLGKKIHWNTNGLIGRYPGAEGMKTGFICASGFNVVATARRGNRRLILVLLGEPTAAQRTIRAAELFDRGFSGQFSASRRVDELPFGSTAAPPNMRATICAPNRKNLADDDNLAAASGDGSSVHAFFTGGAQVRPTTVVEGEKPGTLIRRAEIAPIPVFVGPAKGAAPKAVDVGTAVPAIPAAAPRPAPVVPESATAFAATEQAGAILEGSAPIALQGAIGRTASKGQQRQNVEFRPLPPPRP